MLFGVHHTGGIDIINLKKMSKSCFSYIYLLLKRKKEKKKKKKKKKKKSRKKTKNSMAGVSKEKTFLKLKKTFFGSVLLKSIICILIV